ncbi:tyrosine-type recombinase/integrase [Kibdelosporangium aridum]|uniref:tyrosine-type recombinase/integrase n=1 Tax=Kibdelosporangium aridum TaxID=2030 RepID=UPI00289C8BE5|nr:tyrosine-type recombinase/integrase [Kibdelosporangium aridum]
MDRLRRRMQATRRVSPRVWLAVLAGVATAVGTFLLPDSLQPSDGTLLFVGFGLGCLLTVPRLWPGHGRRRPWLGRFGHQWCGSRRYRDRPPNGFLGRVPERAVKASGLPPPVRLHDLRHGAATLALAAGADMKIVQEMLGHSSITITSDTYTSVLPQVAQDAAEAAARLVPRAHARPHGLTSGSQVAASDGALLRQIST